MVLDGLTPSDLDCASALTLHPAPRNAQPCHELPLSASKTTVRLSSSSRLRASCWGTEKMLLELQVEKPQTACAVNFEFSRLFSFTALRLEIALSCACTGRQNGYQLLRAPHAYRIRQHFCCIVQLRTKNMNPDLKKVTGMNVFSFKRWDDNSIKIVRRDWTRKRYANRRR